MINFHETGIKTLFVDEGGMKDSVSSLMHFGYDVWTDIKDKLQAYFLGEWIQALNAWSNLEVKRRHIGIDQGG